VVIVVFLRGYSRRFPPMDNQTLKRQIESLDPKAHRALRKALQAEYERRIQQEEEERLERESAADPFAALFKKALRQLNQRHIDGTLPYIEEHHPALCERMAEAEEQLEEVWKAGLAGKATMQQYRKALSEWFRLQLRAIEVHTRGHKEAGD
jgi:hypothetical protein